jgi:Fe-S cluster biosynthesis and repair protein YggX
MTRSVNCQVLGKELPALTYAPYPGKLGQRIYEHISAEAWQQWLAHQTMLINENRLSPMNPEHRAYLEEQMEKFLFSGGAEQPAGYVAPD